MGVSATGATIPLNGVDTEFGWRSNAIAVSNLTFFQLYNPLAYPPLVSGGVFGINFTTPGSSPSVTNVTSTSANGTYGPGASIPIQITFSGPVTVTGTPQLTLNDGETVNYSSGSGTNILTFNYSVVGGDTTNGANLDYASTSALSLNGATILDSDGNPVNTALPAPGSAGSLSANNSIIIDATTPTISSVATTNGSGTFGTGTVISIDVNFSENVDVTGTPMLALSDGETAAFSSGSGTPTLIFTYTVAPGDTSNGAYLDDASTAALSLNGGTIFDTVTNPNAANLALPTPGSSGSLSGPKNIIIDTTAPTVVAYYVLFGSDKYNLIGSNRFDLPWEITGIQVVFSKAIDSGDVNSLTGLTTTGFSGLGTDTLTWTLAPVTIGKFTTALRGSGADALKDAAGNSLAGGLGFAQNFNVLEGDFNDDGYVSSADVVDVYHMVLSGTYNIFADINGDGVVNMTDVTLVRQLIGNHL